MTTLSVSSDDLATFLGATVDDDRADQILAMLVDQAATIVSPVPQEALGVIVGAAARVYANPTAVTQEALGPYTAGHPFPGVYLTKTERATLRRLAGGGGAFSIDPIGTGYPDSRFPAS
jgi:hypothetical protein